MATCDHLIGAYPGLGIIGGDLPLGMGVERRAVVIDYMATVWRTYLVIWAAGIPSAEYIAALERRRLKVKLGWVYLQPVPPMEEYLRWCILGFVCVEDPWARQPLASL
jgi:hypothetical protein